VPRTDRRFTPSPWWPIPGQYVKVRTPDGVKEGWMVRWVRCGFRHPDGHCSAFVEVALSPPSQPAPEWVNDCLNEVRRAWEMDWRDTIQVHEPQILSITVADGTGPAQAGRRARLAANRPPGDGQVGQRNGHPRGEHGLVDQPVLVGNRSVFAAGEGVAGGDVLDRQSREGARTPDQVGAGQ
jgi:hypothetical protein